MAIFSSLMISLAKFLPFEAVVGAKNKSAIIQATVIVVVMGSVGLYNVISYIFKKIEMKTSNFVWGTIIGYNEKVSHSKMSVDSSFSHRDVTYFAVIQYKDEYGCERTEVSSGNFSPSLYPVGSKIKLYIGKNGKPTEKVSQKKKLFIGIVFLIFAVLFGFFLFGSL